MAFVSSVCEISTVLELYSARTSNTLERFGVPQILDASGGNVFLNQPGAAQGALIRAASAPTFGA
jgi:hypothetical protein